MIKSKKIKVLVISILCILTITIGLSYGYYLLNKVQENNNIAGSKCFNLEFTNEKNAISLDNMYPISDEEGRKLTPYSFTITNTCDMLAGYTVNMEMLEGTTLNSKYLDVMINNEEIKLLTNYESTNTVITGSTESRILAKGTLAYNDSADYTVRFWMDKDVEDTEAMNKIFKSKIVISATPSSWNPKDAGYDTLHDAILDNEYQTTPADAIKKIEAKGEPDLSKTAPAIKWIEKTGSTTNQTVIKPALKAIKSDDQTSELTENDTKLKLFTKLLFDDETAYYTLSDPVYVDPTTIDYNGNIHYYFGSELVGYRNSTKKLFSSIGTVGRKIYEVKGATKINSKATWNNVEYDGITYNLSLQIMESEQLEIDSSDKGLYQDTDDYGKTYYYRGNIKNNNVYFAGFYWQIIRINGDGSIRLLYNGTNPGKKQSINLETTYFNDRKEIPWNVGYMYGNEESTSYNEAYTNINDSNIKLKVDSWYKLNILNKNYEIFLNKFVGFCGDRTLYHGDGISTDFSTTFGGYERYSMNIAKFSCKDLSRDLYTTGNSSLGNKVLTYPIGLITYDELIFAGLSKSKINGYAWVVGEYYSMTPSNYNTTQKTATMFGVKKNGEINIWRLEDHIGAIPVMNLKSDVKITGGIGTSNDPYVIDTNN